MERQARHSQDLLMLPVSSYHMTSIKTTPSVYITRGLIEHFFSYFLTLLPLDDGRGITSGDIC